MKRFAWRKSHRFSWMLLALVFGFASLSAAADRPLQFRSNVDFSFVEQGFTDFCGFEIAVRIEGTTYDAVFLDRDGNLARVLETTPGLFHTFSNVATGKSYTTVTPASVHITVQGDGRLLFVVDGMVGKIIVGGVTHSVRAGRTAWLAEVVGPGDIEPVGDPIFEAGPSEPPVPALCAALL